MPTIRHYVAMWLSEVLGGLERYTSERGARLACELAGRQRLIIGAVPHRPRVAYLRVATRHSKRRCTSQPRGPPVVQPYAAEDRPDADRLVERGVCSRTLCAPRRCGCAKTLAYPADPVLITGRCSLASGTVSG